MSDARRRPPDPGDQFQEVFWGLLRRKYPQPDLTEIPSAIGGDCGIEGYSSDGIAYQCFADRDSLSIAARTEKQKAKLYRDLQKLRTNAKKLEKILGPLVLKHYFLVVPEYHSSALVAYAVQQAEIVKSWGLSFVGPEFTIQIKRPEDYPAELAAALKDGAAFAIVDDPVVAPMQIEAFGASEPELMARMDDKLRQIGTLSDDEREGLKIHFVKAYLGKGQVMAGLLDWPETWESVERRRIAREEQLVVESLLSSETPNVRLLGTIESYRADLVDHVGGLLDVHAAAIAAGQAAEWLMQCPLSFRGSNNG